MNFFIFYAVAFFGICHGYHFKHHNYHAPNHYVNARSNNDMVNAKSHNDNANSYNDNAMSYVDNAKSNNNNAMEFCSEENSYTAADDSCDSYIECKESKQVHLMCPDGLNFNPAAKFPEYPCSYPMDVPCDGRRARSAMPTSDCPHQYGFFPSPSAQAHECGQYVVCIEGNAIIMNCSVGLAFNPESSLCDWPENVPSCEIEDFLGFQCPPGELDESGNPIVTNHRYESDCHAFFSCMGGKPRLLSCDKGLAFDAESGHCSDADQLGCAGSNSLHAF